VTFCVTTSAGVLYLNNLYGPFGDRGGLGTLVGLGCGAVAGVVVFVLARLVARRSRVALAVLVAAVCAAGWVLLPRQVDVSESWVPQPNPRWSCTGWSFQHYTPGTMDGSATHICVGLEKRISDG
jgi:drug/metabolite transporter (DMT)-like permease